LRLRLAVLDILRSEGTGKGLGGAFEACDCRFEAWLEVFGGLGCCEGAEVGVCVSLVLLGGVAAFDQGGVGEGRTTLPHLAENEVVFYFLGGVEACSFGGLIVVEGDFDPVVPSLVDAALSQCIFGEISVDDDRG